MAAGSWRAMFDLPGPCRQRQPGDSQYALERAGEVFAYNNGIAATACAVAIETAQDGSLLLTEATDFQIVNGAQTTASLAAARRDKKLPVEDVFVPMKLSVVPRELAAEMIPYVSRFANSQRSVRASDFFANHEFHRRVEEISRRLLSRRVSAARRFRPIGSTNVHVVST